MHASISDLTTYSRDAVGDVPKPSIGSSTTVIGNRVYLFGGKSNTPRKNYTADIYAFDLQSSTWEKIVPTSAEDLTPTPRYFHSADHWQGNLVIFGGIGNTPSGTSDTQSVLSDVRFFSLTNRQWLDPSVTSSSPSSDPASTLPSGQGEPSQDTMAPRPRFAHLSTIASNKLFILGGQDMVNEWLDDIHVFELTSKQWIAHVSYPRNCGTYRSAVFAPDLVVRDPVVEGVPTKRPDSVFAGIRRLSQPTPTADSSSVMAPHPLHTNCDQLVHMPYSTEPAPEYPAHLYIYSNWNFVDVRRELETIDPTSTTPTIVNRSAAMMASSTHQPPGLRFPTAHILGTHLIVGGTYLAQSYQSYSIWALDLQSMLWTRIDPGTALTTGSWSRGVLWGRTNRFVVFGNRRGNLVEDYNRRVVNWEHVAYVELESLGIYQPPIPRLLESPNADSLGGGRIIGLDALDAELFADFEVLCEDGRRIKCSRMLLEDRWPWFREHRRKYVNAARQIVAMQQPRSELELDMQPSLPSYLAEQDLSFLPLEDRPDPRLTPRLLRLSEPYPITKALLQYFYTYDLLTPLQHAPLVLSALLLLSSIYNLPHLGELVRHAMHRTLGPMTSVGVYDVTTLCDCQNLNIRYVDFAFRVKDVADPGISPPDGLHSALRIVMSSNRRAAARSSNRQGTGGSGRAPGPGGTGGAAGGYDSSLAIHGRDRSGHSGGYTSGGYASSSDAATSPRGQMGITMSTAPTPGAPASAPMLRASPDQAQSRTQGKSEEMTAVARQEMDSPVAILTPIVRSRADRAAILGTGHPSLTLTPFAFVPPPIAHASQAPGQQTEPPSATTPIGAPLKIQEKAAAVSATIPIIYPPAAAAEDAQEMNPEPPTQPLVTLHLSGRVSSGEISPVSPPESPATIKAPAVPTVVTDPTESIATAGTQGLQAPADKATFSSLSPSIEPDAPPLHAAGTTKSSPSAPSPPRETPASLRGQHINLSVSSSDESSPSQRPTLKRGRSGREIKPAESTLAEGTVPIKHGAVMQARQRIEERSATPTRDPPARRAVDVSPPAGDDARLSTAVTRPTPSKNKDRPGSPPWALDPPQIPAQFAAAGTQNSHPFDHHPRMGFGRQSRQIGTAVVPPSSSAPHLSTPSGSGASGIVTDPSTPGPTPPPKSGFDSNTNSHSTQPLNANVPGQSGLSLGLSFPKIPRRKRSELALGSATNAAPPPTAYNNRPSTADDSRSSGRRRSLSDAGPSRRPVTSSSRASGTSADSTSSSSVDTSSDASAGNTGISAIRPYRWKSGTRQKTTGGLVEHVFREANKLLHPDDPAEIVIRQTSNLEQPRVARRGSQEIYISSARSDEPSLMINGNRMEDESAGSPAPFVVDEHGRMGPAENAGKKSAPSAWSRLWASSTTSIPPSGNAIPASAQGTKTKRGLFSSSTNTTPSTGKADLLHHS